MSYGLGNRWCNDWGINVWRQIEGITKPAQQIMMADWANDDANIWCAPTNTGGGCFRVPHNSGQNYGFLDGHAKWMKPEATIDPEWLWIQYHPGDSCGGGDGGWSQCQRDRARLAVQGWRLSKRGSENYSKGA